MGSAQREEQKDTAGKVAVTGRYQTIPAKVAQDFTRPTFAAGAVLWRRSSDNPEEFEFAVIHRPHYDDYSLAKGKVDPGENLPMTAVREIAEETGFEVRLGQLLGHVTYPVAKRTKVVFYWLAEVTGGEFSSNNEVDTIAWVDAATAREMLSYELDRNVLDKAVKRLGVPVDARLILVRHAHAFSRRTWAGNDHLRPLDKKGLRQVEFLPAMLQGYRPTSIVSALPDRCQQTAQPIAQHFGFELTIDEDFGDDAWVSRMAAVKKRFEALIAQGECPIVVSQGLTIPDVVAWLSAKGRLPLEEFDTKKAGVWVLSFHQGELIGADYLASPLPIK
ncbi:NUDIX hydrolase [Corynebacterium aquilae]|uniref:NTP pyrophosphohydrolase n=1 Tax=Corynebacterium aquilae DSM 44791 TaxID=1431546 RepID=A0A1L7CFM6_9CORY|nr:NUDIX hydrolase [Corynebacterium aquilae]APT84638.1 NTP pyrophosphohydrolase [Corynebacterium aquilae DSM 44791]